MLESKNQAAVIGDAKGKIFTIDQAKLHEDFDVALSATPPKPATFLLYFKMGSSELTEESALDIPKIIAEFRSRAAPDISVIGHTDTLGDAKWNEELSLSRATAIAKLFLKDNLPSDKMAIESHGEKNLLIKTPDNTDEPRNRRVEVTIR